MSAKTLVSLSGGMDSATALAAVLQDTPAMDVACVSFYYGSKHNKYEQASAREFARQYGVVYQVIDISTAMKDFNSNLLLSGGPIPEGHYQAESMKQTVVPGRNLIFLSILAGLAQSHNFGRVVLAVHAGDHAIYPDCRPAFFVNARKTIWVSSDNQVDLVCPFLHISKAAILRRGLQMNVSYQHTRTCYKDQDIACGVCGSCQERLEAFELNGAVDPLEYESRTLLPK